MLRPIIEIQNLKVVYNEGKPNAYYALRGESLEIYPGEYIILFGPSGCGKSTLLYALLGVLAPSSGHMIVRGDDIYRYSVKEMVHFQRSTIGIIFQSFNLIPSISVLDNVALPQIFANSSKAERDRKGMQLLRRFGVDAQAYKLPTNLSGGQMQRVAVARSLVNDPEILLADEPVGNLDSVSSDQVMNMLEDVNLRERKTVILVTHDAKLLPYAHRVYHLKDGQVEGEVINPEKKQIRQTTPGTSILTEIEKLARIYPYASPDELRVKSIVNFLTQDIGFDQVERLERNVKEYIEGRVDEKGFARLLTGRLSKGGVGLDPSRADLYRERIDNLIKEGREIKNYRNNFTARVISEKQRDRIEGVRESLLREVGVNLQEDMQKRLDTLLKYRIRGFIQSDDLRLKFEEDAESGGLGLPIEVARDMSRYLEKTIAQGLYL